MIITENSDLDGRYSVYILSDIGDVGDYFHNAVLNNNKSGSLLYSVLFALSGRILGVNLFVLDSCFVKERHCKTAVRAGLGREKHNAVLRRGALFTFAFTLCVFDSQMRVCDIVNLSLLELLRLTVVPVLNGTVVTGNTAVNLRLCSALGTSIVLTNDISVVAAYGVRGRHCVIRKLIVLSDLANEIRRSLPVGKLFTKERMEYGTRGIKCLEIVLNVKRLKDDVDSAGVASRL